MGYKDITTLNNTCDYHEISVKDTIFDLGKHMITAQDIDTQETFTAYYDSQLEKDLCRFAGVKYRTDTTYLGYINPDLWKQVIDTLYSRFSEGVLTLLVTNEDDNGRRFVKGLVEDNRFPVTNEQFIASTRSYLSDMKSIKEMKVLYDPQSTRSALYYAYNHTSQDPMYGFVVSNDELRGSEFNIFFEYAHGGALITIPKLGYYSSARYTRTVEDSEEILNIMLLNATDFHRDYIHPQSLAPTELKDFYPSLRRSVERVESLPYSCREFREYQSKKTKLYRLSGYTEDDQCFVDMISDLQSLNDFENKYREVSSNHIWRVTAFSNHTFWALLDDAKLPIDLEFDVGSMLEFCDYLGDLVMKPRDIGRIAVKV